MAPELTVTGWHNDSRTVKLGNSMVAGVLIERAGPKWRVAITSYHHAGTGKGPALRGSDGGIGSEIARLRAGPVPAELAERIMARRAEVLKIA